MFSIKLDFTQERVLFVKLKIFEMKINFIAWLEFLGIMVFTAVLIYCDAQSFLGVSFGDVLNNPLSITMAVSLVVFILSFAVSNPGQDRLDKDQLNAWSAEREKELIKHWKDKKEEEDKERELRLARIQTAT